MRAHTMQVLTHTNSLDCPSRQFEQQWLQHTNTFSPKCSSFNSDDYSYSGYYKASGIGGCYRNDSSDVDVLSASTLENTIFDENNMLGVLDAEIYNPIDSILMMDETPDGRVSLAYERLAHIPRPFADTFAQTTHTLDLSHNNLKDLSFLGNFRHLTTLILDQNDGLHENTLPLLPGLRILWLNNCRLHNLAAWLRRLQTSCPSLEQLSLLGNPGCQSTFNGGTLAEHTDYRLFVIGALPQLVHLDDSAVTDAQRSQAAVNRGCVGGGGVVGGVSGQFVEKFSTAGRLVQLFRTAEMGVKRPLQPVQRKSSATAMAEVTNGNGISKRSTASGKATKKRQSIAMTMTTPSATTDSSLS